MYCIYLRKSRADAELEKLGEGETLARHRRTLTELAERCGYEIGEVYEEIVSGETLATRPQMQRLLTDVESGTWQGVIVMEIERLARGNSIDQGIVMQAFKLTDTLIITPAKVYDPRLEFDEEYLEFGLFMSRREYKTINRRLQAGRIASVKEGNYLGSVPPYGYAKTRLEHGKGYSLAVKEDEAVYVRMIYDWFVHDGLTPIAIADKLTQMGVRPKKGGSYFSQHTVRTILQNRHYIGKVVWNWRPQKKIVKDGTVKISCPRAPIEDWMIVDGKHEPIISEELFNAAQARLGACARTKKGVLLRNPFAGIVYCKGCGRAMIYRPHQKCADMLICPNKYCDVSAVAYEIFEGIVLAQLRAEVGALRTIAESGAKPSDTDIQIQHLTAELTKIKKQRNSLYDLLEQGIYTKTVFAERQQTLTDREQQIQSAIAETRSRVTDRKIQTTICNIDKLLTDWHTLDPSHKNLLLKLCIDRITYFRAKSNRYNPQPVEITLDLHF